VVSSESKTRRRYGKTKRESSRWKVWLHAWTQDEDGQSLAGDRTFLKSRSVGKATSKRWLQLFGKRQNEKKSWRKLDTDHQRGHYYEHRSRSIVTENWRRGSDVCPPFFQSAGRGDLLFWGGKEGPTVVIWESLSEQEKESWLQEASTMHDWCKSKKGSEEICSFGKEGPSTLAILITEGPTALQCWSELWSPHPHHPPPIHTHKTNGRNERSKVQWKKRG